MNYFDDPTLQAFHAEEYAAEQAHYERMDAMLRVLYNDLPGAVFNTLPYGACPQQAAGTLAGQNFYFRFRSNTARFELGTTFVYRYNVTSEPLAGLLSPEYFREIFLSMLYEAIGRQAAPDVLG